MKRWAVKWGSITINIGYFGNKRIKEDKILRTLGGKASLSGLHILILNNPTLI